MVNLLTRLIPVESNFELIRQERSFESRFTGARQTLSSPTSYWEFELKFQNLRRDQANGLIARLWGLRGASGRFLLHDYSALNASGIGGNYTVATGLSHLPGLVTIQNVPAGQIVAEPGDYVSINGEFKGVLRQVVGDTYGKAVVEFEPWLRKPVTGGESVNFDSPTGTFQLKPNMNIPRKSSKKLVLAELTISGREAIDI